MTGLTPLGEWNPGCQVRHNERQPGLNRRIGNSEA